LLSEGFIFLPEKRSKSCLLYRVRDLYIFHNPFPWF
jgi:hypothetical protein